MQKLKKTLETNVLKTILKNKSFNVEIVSNIYLDYYPVTFITKNLTINSSRQLKILYNLEICDLKYPLVLKVFENQESLNIYFDFLKERSFDQNIIVTKSSNVVFKDNCYSVVKNTNIKQNFLKLKNLLNPQINLLRILTWKLIKN